MSFVKTLNAKINFWYNYGDLSDICKKISDNIPDKIIINHIANGTIANPKSILNMLNLGLRDGDSIEIIIISDTELHAEISADKIKKIFSNNLNFN